MLRSKAREVGHLPGRRFHPHQTRRAASTSTPSNPPWPLSRATTPTSTRTLCTTTNKHAYDALKMLCNSHLKPRTDLTCFNPQSACKKILRQYDLSS